MIRTGFNKLHRQGKIMIIPILFDLAALLLGYFILGNQGKAHLSFQVLLNMGMPSLSHIVDQPLLANSFTFLGSALKPSALMVLVVIAFLIIYAYMQGGYMGTLADIQAGKGFNWRTYWAYCNKFWARFILLAILTLTAKSGITAFLVIFLNVSGLGIALLLFMFLRIIYVYLEFTLVLDNMPISKALLSQSYAYFKESFKNTMLVMGAVLITAGLLSLLLHLVWEPLIVAGFIVLYTYLITGLQLALMTVLRDVREEASD